MTARVVTGTTFRDFVKGFAGTPLVIDFGFMECECEHPSRILEVGDETVRVVAYDPQSGKPIGEGEFPWTSVTSIRMFRQRWDHAFQGAIAPADGGGTGCGCHN